MNVDVIINGVLIGGIYALVALGLSLVFGILRMINLAHGELVIAGAYLVVFFTTQCGLSALAAAPLAIVVAAAAGYLLQRGLLSGFLGRDGGAVIVTTFGLSILLRGVFTEAAGTGPRSIAGTLGSSGTSLLGTDVRSINLVGFAISVALFLVTYLVLQRTRVGWSVRAAAGDPRTASLMGMNVRQVYALTFAAASALAALGGVILGVAYSVTPTSGLEYLLIAMAVVVVGGVGSIGGTFLGGVLLGLLQAEGVYVFGGQYRDLVVYVVFLAILAIRPQGLMGRAAA